jgi:trimeric autotransporter adhesin
MKFLVRLMFPCLFWAQLSFHCLAQNGIITTYVGPQLPRDGSLAITQSIDNPTSVAPDATGGFYVSSRCQNRIYHVSGDGRIRTVAGIGSAGYSGDGGKAASAKLFSPYGIAVSTEGNIYVADYENNRIRKITPDGLITTVAGNGNKGYGGDGGQATLAQLAGPKYITVDSAGDLYFSDSGNHRVRKITPEGIIATIAGTGTAGFSGDGGQAVSAQLGWPEGVATDSAGNLYVSDGNRIRKVSPAGVITTIAGKENERFVVYGGDGGQATAAQLNGPKGIAVDSGGSLYIADYMNNRIRKVSPDGVITTILRNDPGDGSQNTSYQITCPEGVAVDSAGNVYIADSGNNRVCKLASDKVITTVAGNTTKGSNGDGGQADSSRLDKPYGLAMDSAGNLYIADTGNNRIRKVTAAGRITTVAGNGTAGLGGDAGQASMAQLNGARDVAVDSAGNLYIADSGNHRIRKINPDGIITTIAGNGIKGYSGDGGRAVSAQLNWPSAIVSISSGSLYISDCGNRRIRKITPDGVISTVAGNGTIGYSGDGGQAVLAQLNDPRDIAVDAAGNLYIADSYYKPIDGVLYADSRIRKVTPDGVITTIAGNAARGLSGQENKDYPVQLGVVEAIAVDSTGNLYFGDGKHDLSKITPDGVITTVAGNGTFGYSGDGGPAISAQFSGICGIVLDAAGDLYIADTFNHRIRKVAR